MQLNRLLPNQTFSLGGNAADLAQAMTFLSDNSIVVVGSTESTDGPFRNNRGNKDIFIALASNIRITPLTLSMVKT